MPSTGSLQESFQKYRAPAPALRRLRGFAFDPSLSLRMETAVINEVVYQVPWEGSREGTDPLLPGPVGEYLEVVDFDPASGCFYQPVDLNDPHVLAQDGLAPAEGNPLFHQQMVYAVAMTTIRNFEKALGRLALWSPRDLRGESGSDFVRRLRIYPHALREANAYYSPEKRALLFGYFSTNANNPGRYLPGGTVFTCLSHDIVAHETTHALLDGMHRRFIEPSNPDTLAFHEAFADIVALFQHFSFPEVLRHQIGRYRGSLATNNLLGELAQQFGEAVGNYGALRSALGSYDESDVWTPLVPDPSAYQNTPEPHDRGAILVAAVFDAFLAIYNSRTADLLRIATSGTGVLPAGNLHPDLIGRLADEAAKSAQHVLTVCVRALDYCPPVDISFGDYLRAIITADLDLVPQDELAYRTAFIEAFRRRGIYPRNVRGLSAESLCWPQVSRNQDFFQPLTDRLRRLAGNFYYFDSRQKIHEETQKAAVELHNWISNEGFKVLGAFSEIAGITFENNLEGLRLPEDGRATPRFQVHSLRPTLRVGPNGNMLKQLILSLVQTREIPVAPDGGGEPAVMKFRGGSTLILDLDTMELQYAVTKPINDEARLERHKRYFREVTFGGSPRATYFAAISGQEEPFALLHGGFNHGRP